MSRQPDKQVFSSSDVTTEPQRLALEAMSQELVQKLNIMVAEQEKRAREFSSMQHSLSSLPTVVQTPQVDNTPVTPQATPYKHSRKAKPQKVYQHAVPPAPYPPIPSTPELPEIPQYFNVNYPTPEQTKQTRRTPVVIKGSENKKEEGIGVGTIVTILVVLFIILAKGC